ncbi:YbhB/YbcL family Raf kinase inhibitor-like protein [Tateyamaria omphalii]|uniref:YbhB/YbcL family Raf kinase inhibitor-like protein n=1 Tax=Tateyamaria omphalii TaxID=299262 RepID=UPI001C9A0F48|nr:YbhB/YbcL family Raf kinase inhibitor-like protein [Tateyamaria omphalii]MBY5935094.1 YbhB/YbcL family Raf kinase inhibitor-like protein [Tateyamaria omphalii]
MSLFAVVCLAVAGSAQAEDAFSLTSSALTDGGMLPADLKCARDGGSGASPPLEWHDVPVGTESFALIMHHYPRGTTAGFDTPSHYWLLWNVPADFTKIGRGNPASIGDEGADKDRMRTGYTSPCSPGGQQHEYTITVYALNGPMDDLPGYDDRQVDWQMMTNALEGKVISSAQLSFLN